jgi:hypothetical protein
MATASALLQETLRLLNETALDSSSLGELGNGSGGIIVTTSTTITDYLNEAIAETCRSCVYVPAKSNQITQTIPIINLQDLTCDSAYIPTGANQRNDATAIWFPLTVVAGSTSLVHCSEPTLRAYSPSFENDATGTPKYWYRNGQNSIRVYPAPATSTAFTVYGCGAIANLTANDNATTVTILPDDVQLKMWAAYAAYKIALKNTDDPSVAQRAFWGNWYNETRMRLWASMDHFLKLPGSPFAIPPVTGGQ